MPRFSTTPVIFKFGNPHQRGCTADGNDIRRLSFELI